MKIFRTFLFLSIGLFAISCSAPAEENSDEQNTSAAQISDNDGPSIEDKIKAMGIEIPTPSAPVANYVNAVRTGNLIFLAGKGPTKPDGGFVTGKVGADLTIEQGAEAAKLAAIQHLGVLKAELGSLNKVKRLVKVLGMVNCTPDFTNQPEVINGYSNFMVEVFGEKGKHARAAVGMGSLPRGIAVEVELIVEVED
jgi:enamine deaminase RidA (YjgF/YER057c/UK114 family)